MPTINSLLPLERRTVANTGVVEYLANVLRRAKKDDAVRNKPLPPLRSPETLPAAATSPGSTALSATLSKEDDTMDDEYETTESALRWARGEDFTIDGFIRLSQPIEQDTDCSHNRV